MDALKPGKVFILNIGSRTYPLNEVLTNKGLDNFSMLEYMLTYGK